MKKKSKKSRTWKKGVSTITVTTEEVPRIVEVAKQIATIQANRVTAEAELERANLKSTQIQNQIDVLDSEQRTLEREMDSLTRSMTPRG